MAGTSDTKRMAPVLWAAAGAMFMLAAWLGEQIAFVGIGVVFWMLGLSAWLTLRKKAPPK